MKAAIWEFMIKAVVETGLNIQHKYNNFQSVTLKKKKSKSAELWKCDKQNRPCHPMKIYMYIPGVLDSTCTWLQKSTSLIVCLTEKGHFEPNSVGRSKWSLRYLRHRVTQLGLLGPVARHIMGLPLHTYFHLSKAKCMKPYACMLPEVPISPPELAAAWNLISKVVRTAAIAPLVVGKFHCRVAMTWLLFFQHKRGLY